MWLQRNNGKLFPRVIFLLCIHAPAVIKACSTFLRVVSSNKLERDLGATFYKQSTETKVRVSSFDKFTKREAAKRISVRSEKRIKESCTFPLCFRLEINLFFLMHLECMKETEIITTTSPKIVAEGNSFQIFPYASIDVRVLSKQIWSGYNSEPFHFCKSAIQSEALLSPRDEGMRYRQDCNTFTPIHVL